MRLSYNKLSIVRHMQNNLYITHTPLLISISLKILGAWDDIFRERMP